MALSPRYTSLYFVFSPVSAPSPIEVLCALAYPHGLWLAPGPMLIALIKGPFILWLGPGRSTFRHLIKITDPIRNVFTAILPIIFDSEMKGFSPDDYLLWTQSGEFSKKFHD